LIFGSGRCGLSFFSGGAGDSLRRSVVDEPTLFISDMFGFFGSFVTEVSVGFLWCLDFTLLCRRATLSFFFDCTRPPMSKLR